jgi:predicted Zn-dependent peptidase
MSLERINIGGNIFINFVESDRFKQNYVRVNFISRLENGVKAAKSVLLAKVLMRGSKNYPTMADINRRLNYLYAAGAGAWAYTSGEAQVFSAYAMMLENKYALDDSNLINETLDVLADILMRPLVKDGAFVQDYVETEKTNLKDEILRQINDKGWYAYRKCIENMCKGERYAINNTGEVEDVDKIDGANLYEHYNYILENCAIEIFCVGRLSEKKQFLTDKFKELFKDIKRAEKAEDYSTDVILEAQNKGEIIEEMEVNQGKLVMGFRTGITAKSDDYFNLILFNSLYGGGVTSKLFEHLRERLSLCYYGYSGFDPDKGILTVQSGIEVENKQKTIDEALKQLEDVKSGEFTAQDIENARMVYIYAYKGVYDNLGGIANWYMNQLMRGGAVKTPEEYIDKISSVGRGEIISAANKLTLDTTYFLKGTLLNNDSESEEE